MSTLLWRRGKKLIHLKSEQPEVEIQDRGGDVLMAAQIHDAPENWGLQPEVAPVKLFPLPTEG